MDSQPLLDRGVYVAPHLDPATRLPEILLIDRLHGRIHNTTPQPGEDLTAAMERARELLDVLDPPRPIRRPV